MLKYFTAIVLSINIWLFAPVYTVVSAPAPKVCAGIKPLNTGDTLNKINEYRQANNLTPVVLSAELNTLAAHKAYEYSKMREWAHDINQKSWGDIYKECEYEYRFLGENLAKNFIYSEDRMKAWIKSPTHNAVILCNNYSKVGIFVGGADLDYYTVTTFSD